MATLSQGGPLVSPTVLTSGWQALGTVPTGKVWNVSGWDQVNKDGSNAETVKVAIGTADDSHLIQPTTVIAANGHIPRYRQMTLRAGQVLHVYSASGSRVVMTVHGTEITVP
ncbi:MAG: hypothetical protein V4719_26590 [Planctomycetota bacterium]